MQSPAYRQEHHNSVLETKDCLFIFYFVTYNAYNRILFSPGEKLCSAEDCIPGAGVYLRHGYIHSSLAGYVIRKTEGKEVRRAVG